MSAQMQPVMPSLSAAHKGRQRSPISLTPLIDVVFILLVFFMLASSFLDWRAIRLDPPRKASAGQGLKGAMLVDVRTDSLRLSGEVLTLDLIAARLADVIRERPEQSFIVRPADDVSLQWTLAVLDRLAAAGVTSISLDRVGSR